MATIATANARSDHISQTRIAAAQILDGVNKLRKLREEWNAGFNAWIVDASHDDPNEVGYDPGDFHGVNEGLRVSDITAVSGTTLDALEILLDDGHETNLTKIKM